MDSEIRPRGLECAGTSLGYVSFRQNVRACRRFCSPLPQFPCALSGLSPINGNRKLTPTKVSSIVAEVVRRRIQSLICYVVKKDD